ncbi:MAG: helicase, partial [Sphingomonadaceae bacterium]|nr:helicase [Sphingomonadaceae bacterium]
TPPDQTLLTRLGFRAAGPQMIRVDMAERIAARAHEARAGKVTAAVDPAFVTSLGLLPETVAKLMREIGFHPTEEVAGWVWRGRERRRRPRRAPQSDSHAFAALAALKR